MECKSKVPSQNKSIVDLATQQSVLRHSSLCNLVCATQHTMTKVEANGISLHAVHRLYFADTALDLHETTQMPNQDGPPNCIPSILTHLCCVCL